MIFGNLGGLKLPDICLTGEEKPRKKLTQKICPDRGSNPGPLRDRRACYRLSHNGGPHQLNYATHHLEILQLPSEETALNFQYWDVSSCHTLFQGQTRSFQQDSAPAHKAQTTQQWQEKNIPDFSSTWDWPSIRPYLNPLDYKLWSKASGDGLQVETSQYWKFKAVSSEGSCTFPSWCVA